MQTVETAFSLLLALDFMINSEKTRMNKEDSEDERISSEILKRKWMPDIIKNISWECFRFVGHDIKITEGLDCHGAYVWPSALVLCYYLETHQSECNLIDRNVIEIGAGTGLVSIVASVLGAYVTATDLPDLLGNLQYNVSRNTKMRSKHEPQVKELSWGVDLEKNVPRSKYHYDYILAADVVYSHPYLEELLMTFDHLSQDDTIILWTMKFRLEKENNFVEKFKCIFDVEVIYNLPSLEIKLYRATRKK